MKKTGKVATGKPLPGVETNGSLINWSMVPSWVAGCRLLATWLHTGYRVTDYLVTGSRFIALPVSRNPMRCFVFVSKPHTWEPELSELQTYPDIIQMSANTVNSHKICFPSLSGYHQNEREHRK